MTAPTRISSGGGLGYSLSKANQLWRAELALALRPWEVTVAQFLVLMEVYRAARHGRDAPRQTAVGERLGMDANTTSQVVRGLERRAILTRQPHPFDRRARVLGLTELGWEISREASAAARATNDLFFGVLGEAQEEAVGQLLDTLTAHSRERQKAQNPS